MFCFKRIALSFLIAMSVMGYSQKVNIEKNPDLNIILKVFKKSKTLFDFEQRLNSSQKINSLDLNNDGKPDRIYVIEYKKDGLQYYSLQDSVSQNNVQNVAIIECVENRKRNSEIKIKGDKSIYGENFVISSKTETETDNMTVSAGSWAWSDLCTALLKHKTKQEKSEEVVKQTSQQTK